MKNASILIVTIFSLYGCSSQKKFTTAPPFSIHNPSYQQYAGGREESGTGFILQLPVDLEAGNEIEFIEVFFRGHVLKPELEEQGENVRIVCNHRDSDEDKKPDIIMHSDPKMEVGNQPPGSISKKDKDFPFELKKGEAVISFKNITADPQKSKITYFKITGIKTKPSLIYK
ncbi:MAG: hypothetical protein KJO53_14655 [Eudoraea sp.]|nr:hypothetical protein [Eudoraea sp.]MBT8294700.1 hypothetical protein [Eudoraea sp.]NNL03417.1 hypothetical protein [Eudoraea sp.]